MADDTQEYMEMNQAYKGRIINTLRNPLKSDKDSVTVVKPSSKPTPTPAEAALPKKKQLYPGDSLKSAIGDAYDKYLGPKELQ